MIISPKSEQYFNLNDEFFKGCFFCEILWPKIEVLLVRCSVQLENKKRVSACHEADTYSGDNTAKLFKEIEIEIKSDLIFQNYDDFSLGLLKLQSFIYEVSCFITFHSLNVLTFIYLGQNSKKVS